MRIPRRARLVPVLLLLVPSIALAGSTGPAAAAGGVNLISNSGFESSLTGWVAVTSKLTVATDGDGGGKAAKAAVNGKSKPPAYGVSTGTDPVTSAPVGERYTANARVRSDTPGKTVCLVVKELAPAGATTQTQQQCGPTTNGWTSLPATALTISATGHDVSVTVQQVNGVAGDTFETDNVTLVDSDTSAPAAPGSFTATATSQTQVNLVWQAAADTGGAGVKSYAVTRNGTAIATLAPTATTYADTGLSAGTAYSYGIAATDYAGNTGATATASTTTLPDLPPTVPGNLTATAASPTEVDLSWSASTDTDGTGVSGYVVVRDGNSIATLGPTATGYADTSVVASTSYSYTVKAFDTANQYSASTAPANVSTPAPPPDAPPTVPGNVTATATSPTHVDVTWTASTDTDSTGVAGYVVSRDGSTVATLGPTATSYADTTVVAGTSYSYTVKAFDTANNSSADSAPAPVTTPTPPPDNPPSVPGNVTATATSPTHVDVTWTASTDTDSTGVSGYVVSRDGSTVATLGSSATSWSDTTVVASTRYSYTVRAFDTANNSSADSAPATVTTPAPPVDNPPTVPGNLTATAVSSAEVDLSWSASTDTDATGLAGYQITRNGSVLATVGPSSVGYVDFAVSPSTTYTYSVKAYDTANNYSAATPNASASTPGGTTAQINSLWHMDETSGTTMVDSGPNPHNGILKNVTLGQPGDPSFPGTSYFFNGSADASKWSSTAGSAVDLGTGDDLNAGGKDVRIAFSVKTTTVPPTPDYDLFRKGEYPGTEYKIELQPNGQMSCEFRTLQSNGSTITGYTIQPAIDVHDGLWHRFTCSKVGNVMTVTVDGVAFTKSITGTISNTYHLVVGAYNPDGTGDAFRGQMDELSFKIG